MTPEAKDATMDEVIYAGLVGFISGGISSGGASAILTNASNLQRNNKIQAERQGRHGIKARQNPCGDGRARRT